MVYSQLPSQENEEEEDAVEMTELTQEDAFHDEINDFDNNGEKAGDDAILYDRHRHEGGVSRLPDLAFLEEQLLYGVWNRWEEPCLLSSLVTSVLVVPLLVGLSLFVYNVFTGRFWSIWIFALHLQFRLIVGTWYIKSITTSRFQHRKLLRIICSLLTLLEVVLCGAIYPIFTHAASETFFRDVDGSWVSDWKSHVRILQIFHVWGWVIVGCRGFIGLTCIFVRVRKYFSASYREWRPVFMQRESLSDSTQRKIYKAFQVSNWTGWAIQFICILSLLSHFGPWPLQYIPSEDCNSLDETECALPFPSFHHMRLDASSTTEWRVSLKGLPPLRGGIPFHPQFLNELDGFSTMAPILFYMKGMKEGHENGKDHPVRLRGPAEIEFSTTAKSITLLLNVDEGIFVPHSAEIDYLDTERPLVLIIPAQPLHHGTHYAVIVQKAMDMNGQYLSQTQGMKNVLKDSQSETYQRYMHLVFPAFQEAADWITTDDTQAALQESQNVQLLFDFVTASAASQIGKTRAVRDSTLAYLESSEWHWEDHIRIIKREEFSCENEDALIAQTLHVEFDVPWFLKHANSRFSAINSQALESLSHVTIGQAKAMIQVPCSLERSALNHKAGKKLRAIMEFGHGIFYHRGEVRDKFLSSMANRNGYLLFSMDWRGMSAFDLPVVIKTLVGNPNSFRSVRDNLIQGMANKLAFQHFCKHGLLDWLRVKDNKQLKPKHRRTPSVFYGISQGGILGGGYMALSGNTNLIDRGILGVPGTPFTSVLTRSLDFAGYDQLLLLNFYNNRHVRMLLSLVQMGWDSVEASGLLAEPLTETLPPVLLQAGLGDPIVPTAAAESLARAMHGATLPNNPRTVYGLESMPAASNSTWNGPNVTLTEMLYQKEYSSLPVNDVAAPNNRVHLCIRLDSALIYQIEKFTNTGKVIDPCVEDQCIREFADC